MAKAYCKTKFVTAENLDENTESKDSTAAYSIHGSQCGHPFKDRTNVDKAALDKCKDYQGTDNCITY